MAVLNLHALPDLGVGSSYVRLRALVEVVHRGKSADKRSILRELCVDVISNRRLSACLWRAQVFQRAEQEGRKSHH